MTINKELLKKFIFPFVFSIVFAGINVYYMEEKSILIFGGLFVAFFLLSSLFIIFKEKIFENKDNITVKRDKGDKKTFLIYFGILFVSWFVLLLAFFPGVITYDATYSANFFNINNITSYPIFYMIIARLFFDINSVISPWGFFLLSLSQIIAFDLFVSFMMLFLYRIGVKKWFRILVLVFFAVAPVVSTLIIVSGKDPYFSAVFGVFIVLLAYYIFDKKTFDNKLYCFLYVFTLIIISLLRANGRVIFFILIPLLLLVFHKNKRVILLTGVTMLIGIILNIALPAITGFQDFLVTEGLSMNLQQLGRVYTNEQDTLTNEEKEEILYVVPGAKNYNPYISDNLKQSYSPYLTPNMLNVWFKYLWRYPKDYIDSLLLTNQGFFYMFDKSVVDIYYDPINEPNTSFIDLDCHAVSKMENQKLIPFINDYIHNLLSRESFSHTITQLLFNNYYYVWGFLFMVVLLIAKKEKCHIMIVIITMMYFISLLLGPCALPRYLLPIVSILPLLTVLASAPKTKKE